MIPYFQALFIQRHGMISALMIYGHPEYLILFLKYSVLGLGGIKEPAEDDLRFILVFTLFL